MPTYLYECSACQTQFETVQRITEAPLSTCQCGSEGTVKRLIQPTAIMFKGSGFYVNDSAASAKKSDATPSDHPVPACSGEPKSCGACATDAT